jgi:hypothetical protein
MSTSILDMLMAAATNRPATGSCPSPREILGMASGDGTVSLDLVKRWPSHLLSCALCANRWELIQRDSHCDPADVLAMENLAASHFFSMVVASHLERCFPCRKQRAMVHNFILVDDPHSVHWSNIGTLLRQNALAAIHRGPQERKLGAAVLDASGKPSLHLDELERVDLDVNRAELTEDGTVTVELLTPSWCTEVRLALTTGSYGVMFPFVRTDGDRVRFVAASRVHGAGTHLPLSSLTAWVRRK